MMRSCVCVHVFVYVCVFNENEAVLENTVQKALDTRGTFPAVDAQLPQGPRLALGVCAWLAPAWGGPWTALGAAVNQRPL